MALVELGRYFNSFEAGLAKARLDAEGIPSFIFDMEMNWGGIAGGVVQRPADGRRRGSGRGARAARRQTLDSRLYYRS